MKGKINSIETMGLVDGPGIRVVVFMQGCRLRCLFCHNPEMWDNSYNMLMTPEELLAFIQKYQNYFGNNGGVTFSGGEPLIQEEFLLEALKLCKQNGIHTCLDTSGVGNGNYEEILKYVDLVIYDIKALDNDSYKKMTGKNIEESLYFLDVCQRLNKELWIRQVIIPTINDNEEYILKLKHFISKLNNVKKVELLPYHLLGVQKYDKLGLEYKLKNISVMNKKRCDELYKKLVEI